jgi:hypothetical protein
MINDTTNEGKKEEENLATVLQTRFYKDEIDFVDIWESMYYNMVLRRLGEKRAISNIMQQGTAGLMRITERG